MQKRWMMLGLFFWQACFVPCALQAYLSFEEYREKVLESPRGLAEQKRRARQRRKREEQEARKLERRQMRRAAAKPVRGREAVIHK